MAKPMKDYIFEQPVGTHFRIAQDTGGASMHIVGSNSVRQLRPGELIYIWYKMENKGDPIPFRVAGECTSARYWISLDDFTAWYNDGYIIQEPDALRKFLENNPKATKPPADDWPEVFKDGDTFMVSVDDMKLERVAGEGTIRPAVGDLYVFEKADDANNFIFHPKGNDFPQDKVKISVARFALALKCGELCGVRTLKKKDVDALEKLVPPKVETKKEAVRTLITERDLELGDIYEVWDGNSDTWVVGLLRHKYDCETHPGVILELIRDNGSTVDIDSAYAKIYTAPNYNIEHFKRTLKRQRYELRERMAVIERGLSMCAMLQTEEKNNYKPKSETVGETTTPFEPEPQPAAPEKSEPEKELSKSPVLWIGKSKYYWDKIKSTAHLIGWIDDSLNTFPASLHLIYELDPKKILNGEGVDVFPLKTIDDKTWIDGDLDAAKYFGTDPNIIKMANSLLKVYADKNPSEIGTVVPKLIAITIKSADNAPVATVTSAPSSLAIDPTPKCTITPGSVISTTVDETLWFNMGWQPSMSVGKYEPMYLIGTRWLKHGSEDDLWIFLTNRGGYFGVIAIPVKCALTYYAFEEACARSSYKISDLTSTSELGYANNLVDHYKQEIANAFCEFAGKNKSLVSSIKSGINFAPIRIIPTKMPTLQ